MTARAVPRLLLSHDEAAAALAISPRTLDRIVARGDLKKRVLNPGGIRYLMREVEALAESLPVILPGLPAPADDPTAG